MDAIKNSISGGGEKKPEPTATSNFIEGAKQAAVTARDAVTTQTDKIGPTVTGAVNSISGKVAPPAEKKGFFG